MRSTTSIGLSAFLLSAVSAAKSTSSSSSFQIYGYGTGIGGAQLFSSGGSTYFGDYQLANDTEAAPVVFTPSGSVWLGSPNTTVFDGSDVPDWSNYTFSVPSAGSSSHDVNFLSSSNETGNVLTTGFTFYGTFIFVTGTDGNMESLWYALPTDTDGIYKLQWNTTGDDSDDKVLLTLKKTPPSSSK
ncbi:hypothetical protein EDB81DRAFT_49994 [Dactylonectria macrodidyma]|uniref:Uncharacterized protein n=1 Tax=Dactylonectria macrodidyma TaxID=307937 RepID=A0A9P9JJJ9_9HYPO|nr:hypothetical protein EDB81DRAFT_49994 [Dactylonectria macrodidyma]